MRSVALLNSSACLLETTPASNMKVAGLSFQQETTIYGSLFMDHYLWMGTR